MEISISNVKFKLDPNADNQDTGGPKTKRYLWQQVKGATATHQPVTLKMVGTSQILEQLCPVWKINKATAPFLVGWLKSLSLQKKDREEAFRFLISSVYDVRPSPVDLHNWGLVKTPDRLFVVSVFRTCSEQSALFLNQVQLCTIME